MLAFFNTILDFYAKYIAHNSVGTALAAVVLWAFWPGLMFIVGAVAESRLVPLWEHQSRMFFPGDLMLGVILLRLLDLHLRTRDRITWGYSWWWLIVIVAMAVVAWLVRSNDVGNYPYDVTKSPTKWVHDTVGYFIFPALYLGLGLPQIVRAISHPDPTLVWCWVSIALPVVFYLGCTAYDLTHQRTIDDLLACHPAEWRPLWRK